MRIKIYQIVIVKSQIHSVNKDNYLQAQEEALIILLKVETKDT